MQCKYLNVTSDDLWRIRDKLDGKRSSLGKAYKMNKEANDKEHDLNQQASKYLEALTLLYWNFEQICTEKREVEEQFRMRRFRKCPRLRCSCNLCWCT